MEVAVLIPKPEFRSFGDGYGEFWRGDFSVEKTGPMALPSPPKVGDMDAFFRGVRLEQDGFCGAVKRQNAIIKPGFHTRNDSKREEPEPRFFFSKARSNRFGVGRHQPNLPAPGSDDKILNRLDLIEFEIDAAGITAGCRCLGNNWYKVSLHSIPG